MNENMMEALQVQEDEARAHDSEQARVCLEEWDEPIVPKMMGKDYGKFFFLNEGEDERAHKHYWDAMHTN